MTVNHKKNKLNIGQMIIYLQSWGGFSFAIVHFGATTAAIFVIFIGILIALPLHGL